MFYYAVVNIKDIVEYIESSETEVEFSDYISIPNEDQSLIGKWYDRYGKYGTVGVFMDVPISVSAQHSTNEINYKSEDVWLNEKLDSYATRSELSNYALSTHTHAPNSIGAAEINHIHSRATISSDGFMSSSDKVKLNGIEEGANKYIHPSSHNVNMIEGLSDVATSGDYNDLDNKPTRMQPTDHTHAQNDISGLSDTLLNKSDIRHTHSEVTSSNAGFMSSLDKIKLNGIEEGANNYVHPSTHEASMITGLADIATTGSYEDLLNKPTIPGAYVHPSTHPASMITGLSKVATSGNYNDLSNKPTSMAPTAHTHSTSDITELSELLDTKANTDHTHSVASTSASGFMSAQDKTKLNGIASNANNYTHPANHSASMITGLSKVATSGNYNDLSNKPTIPTAYVHPSTHPASMITGLATVATSGNYEDLSDKPTSMAPTAHTHAQSDITGLSAALSGKSDTGHTHTISQVSGTVPINKGGTGATTAAAALSNLGITATAAELNKLDGVTATTAEINYVDGVTSNIQTQLNGKSASNHNHDSKYISKSLQMTANDGDVSVSWSNQDVIAKIKALGTGMYTAYAKGGTTNNPKTTESWRFLIHKTGATFGWVQAFGSLGSMYIGYVDSGTWKGWKCVYDADPAPLWKGAMYMSSPNSTPQTVTPSKKLSECRNGWLLLWSDYDKDTSTANDSDFVTTMIPKSNPTGGNWGGKAFYCDIPRYIGSNVSDVDTERRIIKSIYIHDNCIKGSFNNDKDERTDVVLRAVYEY